MRIAQIESSLQKLIEKFSVQDLNLFENDEEHFENLFKLYEEMAGKEGQLKWI